MSTLNMILAQVTPADTMVQQATDTLQQAMRIADYVIFMYEGKIIEQGKAYDIFHNPKEQLTSDYLFGTFS